ncbi:MAG TPA: HEAT repeat domain-containing protein [Rhizomicrobium sp.]|jgi:HEAT repeat protein
MPLIRKDPVGASPPSTPSSSAGDLQASSAETRWNAARRLAKDPESVAALGRALGQEDDPRVREALFTSLAYIQSPQAIATILPHIRSDDASIRAGALDALATVPDAVEKSVPTLLSDPDPDVRILICDVVRRLPGPLATQYLCDLLTVETHPNVCGAAVEALSEVGNETALPVLAQCADRFASEPFLVFSISMASKRVAGNGRPVGSQAV